jgi:hypothetical protein
MKRVFALLFSLSVALGVGFSGRERWAVRANQRDDFKQAVGSGLSGTFPPAWLAEGRASSGIRFVPRTIKESSGKFNYTINARYPQAASAQGPRIEKLNQEIKGQIDKEIGDFKKEFESPDARGSRESPNTFDAEYFVEMADKNLVSIAFAVSTFYSGAAHPNHYTSVFNYDLNAGKRLELADLFKPNSNYLQTISDYCIKDLKEQLGPEPDVDWIKRGAAAEPDNYRSWNITPKGLEITFDPYQVASYAEGPHEVVVPYSVLKDVIDREGPIASLAKNSRGTRRSASRR